MIYIYIYKYIYYRSRQTKDFKKERLRREFVWAVTVKTMWTEGTATRSLFLSPQLLLPNAFHPSTAPNIWPV